MKPTTRTVTSSHSCEKLVLAEGAWAQVTSEGDAVAPSVLEVYDQNGKVVLTYDARAQRVQLGFVSTTLTVNAQSGDTELRSTGKLTLSGRDVEVIGEQTSLLGVRSAGGQVGASLAVVGRRLAVFAKRLDVRAEREHREIADSVTFADSHSVVAHELRQQAARMETAVGTIITRAKEAFAYIDGENHLEAQRATWKIAQTLWVRTKRAFLKSDKDINIDGEKVNIG